MIYSKASSYDNAPGWVQNKYIFEMPFITHHIEHCSPLYCNLKPAQHITHRQWQHAFIPYIELLNNIYGSRSIWLMDMPLPILEKAMKGNIIQVFHGELFEIGPAPYFASENLRSFDTYGRIFAPGKLLVDEILRRTKLRKTDKRIRITGRVLNDTLYSHAFKREHILKQYNLDPKRKTLLYAPSWESQKIWGIGTGETDEKDLYSFCKFIQENDLNFIIRPHPICIYQYGLKPRISAILKKFSNTYFDDSTKSTFYGPNKTLIAADIMVTDLSTIAGDFLSLDKPVIFLYPDKNNGLWGKFFPSINEVGKISYVETTHRELQSRIVRLLKRGETPAEKNHRKSIVRYLFAHTDGSAGRTFSGEMDEYAQELLRSDASMLNNTKLRLMQYFKMRNSYPINFSAHITKSN